MRNVGIFTVVIAVAVISVVIYQMQPAEPVVEQPPAPTQPAPVTPAKEANPLTVATYGQFRMWVTRFPIPCNEIVYAKPEPEHIHYDFCIGIIIDRVAEETNVKLTKADVLDPKAKARWAEVMGG